jgi:hypothetical protein
LDKAKSNSISKVSQTLGIDWHTANTILKSWLFGTLLPYKPKKIHPWGKLKMI